MALNTLLIPVLLTGALFAQPNIRTLDVRISTETVPAGTAAQIKVFLASPAPISNGYIRLLFDSAQANAVSAATVFSATGDVSAVGRAETFASKNGFRLFFRSPSAGVGVVPGLPIAEISISVAAAFAISLDTASSYFNGPDGKYVMRTAPGGAQIGGPLSIRQVTPSGSTGILEAGTAIQISGTGFTAATSIAIDGVAIASVVVQSSEEIDVTMSGPTEITGKRIVLRNPDGQEIDYWGGLGNSLYTLPLSASPAGSCIKDGPALRDPAFLILQNANPVASDVAVSNAFNPSTLQPDTVSASIAAGESFALNIVDPASSSFSASGSMPIRATCYYTTRDPDLNVLTWPETVLQQPLPSLGWVANAASQVQGAVAPGEIITIYGTVSVPFSGVLSAFGKSVLFDGRPTPTLYSSLISSPDKPGSATLLTVMVPYEVNHSSIQIQLENSRTPSAAWSIPIAPAAPAIFSADGTGTGQAAALNENDSINSISSSAPRGSVIRVYATGLGTLDSPVQARIGGLTAEVRSVLRSMHFAEGVSQVDIMIPTEVVPGTVVPIGLSVGDASSPNIVTVAIE